ncbi:MAG: ABC transporter ATP-binding protein [Erysipelotrichaceae bacterium]|nr:ABC transporter ATP-binding protein [Erysipelotrichaceae bacterium]
MPTQKGFAPKGTLKRLLKDLFHRYRFLLIIVMLCLAINAATNFSASIFIKNFTDTLTEAVKGGDWEAGWKKIVFLSILLGSIYLLGVVASLAWNLILVHVTQNYLNETRIKMFNHMETLPIRYFDTHKHGDIMSIYTNDTDTLRQLISQALPTLFSSIVALIGIFAIMFTYSIWLALIVMAGGFFMILTLVKLGGKAGKFFSIQQKALGSVEGNIEESINGLKVIKVFSHEELSTKEFDEKNEALYEASSTGNKAGNIMMPINGNIGNFIYILCSIVGAVLFFTKAPNISLTGVDTISIGIILSFLSISRGFTNNVNNVSQNLTSVVGGMAGTARILALLDEPEERDSGYCELVHIKYNEDGSFEETEERTRNYAWKHPHQADGSITYTELKGDIVLEDVTFGYVPEKTILKHINIYARPGQRIALVGATGAGKTTITNLLNRFYYIEGGKIRYDGINITKIKKNQLRKCLGIVLQDVNLFSGTVMDNIRYGRLDATDEECIEAAKIANAHDFITRLPKGYDTELTGDGGNLSQGQRQLLSIARAAVADTPVLILDEATSSIDTRTEKLVQAGMDKLMEGRTVFVIAHRLSTIQNCDAIMVMDHGEIIERGNHEQLIAQKGVYYQLYTGKFELE